MENQENAFTRVYSQTRARKIPDVGRGKVKNHSRFHSTRPRSWLALPRLMNTRLTTNSN